MVDLTKRRAFADFLERLSTKPFNPDDWLEYAVNHYHDKELEEIRRRCVRLSIEAGESFPDTPEHHAQLREWAKQLRSPTA